MARGVPIQAGVAIWIALVAGVPNVQASDLVVEYYHAGLNHYFITASAADIYALDTAHHSGWGRTGETFLVNFDGAPVCRFYIPPELGDSHFYSASGQECEEVRLRFPALVLETMAAFRIGLPDPVTGVCPPDSQSGVPSRPIYRLWNQRAASNHRYTATITGRDYMISQGWVSEGYGPSGTAMCSPTTNDACLGCWDY